MHSFTAQGTVSAANGPFATPNGIAIDPANEPDGTPPPVESDMVTAAKVAAAAKLEAAALNAAAINAAAGGLRYLGVVVAISVLAVAVTLHKGISIRHRFW